ncbi:MAG: ADP-ribosylglycohydrolase family protein, partial [Lachnospiraceae bacterium]|nr:ADP-ribosylglycohydrolase family protein [Lachnospiraceae bacterium]
MATKLEKMKGCMFGGAIGDALGYAVEFRRAKDIFHIYGKHGIQDYELFHGKACISDDTQMTLFTANGLLCAYTDKCLHGTMRPW